MAFELCHTSDINDPGSMGFEILHLDKTQQLFVVHKDAKFYAFFNNCPHTGVNLDWNEHQFLDMDKCFIQCATHDALFDIPSGECIAGPCVGKYLTVIPLEIRDGVIFVKL